MKESHRKDLANHPGPESCTGNRQAAGEALTVRVGMRLRVGLVLLVVAMLGIVAVLHAPGGGVSNEDESGKEPTETRAEAGIEDDRLWKEVLANKERHVVLRREVPVRRDGSQGGQRAGRHVSELASMEVGSLTPEAIEQLTLTVAASLAGARARLGEATRRAASATDLESLAWLAHVEADVRKHELCMDMIGQGLYTTVPDGTNMLPLATNVDWLLGGGVRSDGVAVQVVFLIMPGDDREYDAKRARYNELVALQVKAIADAFNSLPYGERARRIDAHETAMKNIDAVYQAQDVNSDDKRRMAQQFERNLIDKRLKIDGRSCTVSHK